MKTRLALIVTATVLAIIAIGGISYYRANHKADQGSNGQNNTGTPTSTNTPTPSAPAQNPATPSPTSSTTPQSYVVNVYFSRSPESDDDPSKVFPLQRTSTDLGVAAFAIKELLKGPTEAEKSQKYSSDVRVRSGASTCDNQDFSIAITNGVAELKFCRPFDHVGEISDGRAESQINATLKQFQTIQKVRILNSQGDCEFNLSGMNLCKQ